MDSVKYLFDLLLHFDEHLKQMVENFGSWTYLFLFLIVFCETGLVVTPFLPGDSLLFAAGAVAALAPDTVNLWVLMVLLLIAAITGDAVNYSIGYWIGPRAFSGKIPLLKQEYLLRAQAFYVTHGGKAIFLARFIPIIRTFAPFVAGIGRMNYAKFAMYNIIGGVVWVVLFLLLGYYCGNIPFVKKNFEIVILGIIGVSVLPIVWEVAVARLRGRKLAEVLPAESQPPQA
jgi:membrane-associated protein